MAHHLVVESEEAERLAAEIARETGQSIAAAVTQTLRERAARIPMRRGKASREELLEFIHGVAISAHGPAFDHGEWLYDENGIPK
jgi:hypothetical protein